jgi:hypothetical protein
MSESCAVRRALCTLFAAGGVATLALLVVHPHGRMQSFPDMVEFEIRFRLLNALVHGGAIALFLVLLAGHIALARLITAASLPVTLAVTAFGGGCAFIAAALVLDGLVTPALALQYRAAQDLALQHSIEALMRFCGINIRTLMPMALLSFAASALAWCAALVPVGGRSRFAGVVSGVVGVLVGVMISAAAPAMLEHAALAGVSLIGLWQIALALVPFDANVSLGS